MQTSFTFLLGALALAACAAGDVASPDVHAMTTRGSAHGTPGAVYTLTNQTDGNSVAIFDRAATGQLTFAGSVSTGGAGTAAGLGSQSAIVLSDDDKWLLGVNAGSNDISIFNVAPSGIALVHRVASGGERPVSVAIRRNIVYVLNAGGAGNIAGFTIDAQGILTPLAGSTQPLSAPNAGGAQVSFTPDGRALVVAERATNLIGVYPLDAAGRAMAPVFHASSGVTPFGFDFDERGTLIVSEAFGGMPNASATSSYRVGEDGALEIVTGSLGTMQTAACWLVVSKDGRFAWTANAGSSSLTGYAVAQDGSLSLIDADGVTASTGVNAGATDMAISGNGRFLYVLTPRTGMVAAYEVGADGRLTAVPGAGGLPAGTVGLAAR